jgi:hypothetical protein
MSTTSIAERRELIAFRIGEQEFCVDIRAVREIRGWTKATALPQSPAYVRGVINLRGDAGPEGKGGGDELLTGCDFRIVPCNVINIHGDAKIERGTGEHCLEGAGVGVGRNPRPTAEEHAEVSVEDGHLLDLRPEKVCGRASGRDLIEFERDRTGDRSSRTNGTRSRFDIALVVDAVRNGLREGGSSQQGEGGDKQD